MTEQLKGLFIPANSRLKAVVVPVGTPDQLSLSRHVGGFPERTQYDYDAAIYVDGMGALKDSKEVNERATYYIKNESDAAKQGRFVGGPPEYALYGDVVIVGEERSGGGEVVSVDVPERLVERFAGPERVMDAGR